MGFIKKTIQKHIESLEGEYRASLKMLDSCDNGSILHSFVNAGKESLNFKISVWREIKKWF